MRYVIVLLALAGAAVSAMALHVHNMDPSAAPPCAVSEHWDCGRVGHSKYSWFPAKSFDEMMGEPTGRVHIPVAAIGIAGYAAIVLFALLGRMPIVLAMAGVGFLCAAYLSYIEAYVLKTWCIYCVWSQGIIAVLLLASGAAVLLEHRKRAVPVRTVLAQHVD